VQDLVLVHFTNDEWETLETSMAEEGENDVYYIAQTNSFSLFAIELAGKEIVEEEPEIVVPDAEEPETGSTTTQEPAVPQPPAAPVSEPASSEDNTIWIILLAVIVVVGAVWFKRKGSGKQLGYV
jgi:hypothetical protein